MRVHQDLPTRLAGIGLPRVFALSTRGIARYDTPCFTEGDACLFGPETRGLPAETLAQVPEAQRLYLPMRPDNRSLNVSNAVGVMVFEAWRQQAFVTSKSSPPPRPCGLGSGPLSVATCARN